MTWRDHFQLLAGFFGTGLFYAGYMALDMGGFRFAWLMLVGCAACAALICGPVSRHVD